MRWGLPNESLIFDSDVPEAHPAGFVAVGVPLVALAWHNVNHLRSGDLRLAPRVTVVVAGAGLAGLLYVLARVIERWTDVKREA